MWGLFSFQIKQLNADSCGQKAKRLPSFGKFVRAVKEEILFETFYLIDIIQLKALTLSVEQRETETHLWQKSATKIVAEFRQTCVVVSRAGEFREPGAKGRRTKTQQNCCFWRIFPWRPFAVRLPPPQLKVTTIHKWQSPFMLQCIFFHTTIGLPRIHVYGMCSVILFGVSVASSDS